MDWFSERMPTAQAHVRCGSPYVWASNFRTRVARGGRRPLLTACSDGGWQSRPRASTPPSHLALSTVSREDVTHAEDLIGTSGVASRAVGHAWSAIRSRKSRNCWSSAWYRAAQSGEAPAPNAGRDPLSFGTARATGRRQDAPTVLKVAELLAVGPLGVLQRLLQGRHGLLQLVALPGGRAKPKTEADT